MLITIRRGDTKKNIKKILERLSQDLKPKGVNVFKYVGTIKLKEDALKTQKQMRNEWE